MELMHQTEALKHILSILQSVKAAELRQERCAVFALYQISKSQRKVHKSIRGYLWQKERSKSEKEGLEDGGETCCDGLERVELFRGGSWM